MISVEKLTLFNMESFKKLYMENENAYNCDKSFFEIYDKESFVLKYIIRKQIRLFKVNEEYMGYIWFEYPSNHGLSNIYAIYIKDEFAKYLEPSLLSSLKSYAFKFDAINNLKIAYIMNKLKFQCDCETIFMKILSSNCLYNIDNKNVTFKHFKNKHDEKLRCNIQNAIFNEKGRIPLTTEDIYLEEDEDYYIEDYGVFICDEFENAVGYGQIIYNKGIYTIVNFGILSQYRNHGYGEILVRYLIKLCYDNSITDVYIRVEKKNYKAIALYEKVGFKEHELLTTWYKRII